jgi:hypothetical protein
MSYIGASPTQVAFVTDTFSGNGSTTAFTMSVAPANAASVLVAISGVLQDPTTYSVAGTTLTFSAAPPTGTGNISSRYLGIPASNITTTAYRTITEFTATAGQTTFTPSSYTVGFIEVYRNGVFLGSADYTASNGTTVVLAVGATAGDLVTVVGFYVSSVINAIPATTGSVGSTYIAAGAVGTTQLASAAVTQTILATGVAGTGPAFSAYQSSSQSIANGGSFYKVQFQTEEFDTNNNFDSTTNYRFTPTVAGYYQFSCSIGWGANSSSGVAVTLYKNGSLYKIGTYAWNGNIGPVTGLSCLASANGSTDYFEIYVVNNTSASLSLAATSPYTYFQAAMVRSA